MRSYIQLLLEKKQLERIGLGEEVDDRQKQEDELQYLEHQRTKIGEIDKQLQRLDFVINFNIEKVSIEMTGNKSDLYGNSKLMSFGFEK